MQQQPAARDPWGEPQSAFSRLIDRYNPGITMLVGLWTVAFAVRERLSRAAPLEPTIDNAFKSLLLVIPIMLAGWGLLTIVDRRFRLGLFR